MNIMYNLSVILIITVSVIIFIMLFYISAPYGKFLRKGWGITISAKWAWLIMEFPSPALMILFFFTSDRKEVPQIIFISLWSAHYFDRTFIYSFTQSGREKPLFPRGVSTHKWYKVHFPGYPGERKAIIPFII